MAKFWARMRTAKLASLFKQGGDEATAAARSMMDKMVENSVADAHHFSFMLKLCTSSDEMRKVIDVAMLEAGVKPDAVTYSTLINMLRVEGDDEAAKNVVEEMRKAKVQPNEITKERARAIQRVAKFWAETAHRQASFAFEARGR